MMLDRGKAVDDVGANFHEQPAFERGFAAEFLMRNPSLKIR